VTFRAIGHSCPPDGNDLSASSSTFNPLAWLGQHVVTFSVLGACLVITLCAAVMRWQPLTMDENDFFLAAADWLNLRQVIPHPQLYVHLVQLCFAVWGITPDAARLSVLVPNLITVALIPWLVKLVYRDDARRSSRPAISVLAVWLYALSPFVIQNSVLIDIDNGVLTTALTLMLCLWFALKDAPARLRVLLLSLGFAACLWFKLPTPPMLVVAIALFSALRGAWRDAGVAVMFGAIGAGLFVGTHTIYSTLTGYTLAEAASALIGRTDSLFGGLSEILNRTPQGLGVFVFWIGLPLSALVLIAGAHSARRLLGRQLLDEDLLISFGLLVILSYSLLIVPAWGYPRYQAPALPVIAIVVSALVVAHLPRASRTLWAMLTATFIFSVAYLFVVVRDPLYDIYRATFDTTQLADRLYVGGLALVRLLPPLIVAFAISILTARQWGLSRSSILIAALIATTFGFYVETTAVQVVAGYSTRYRYTYLYADRQRALEFIQRSVTPSGFTLTDKDILFYAHRPGDAIYTYICPTCQPAPFIQALRARRVDAVVWTDKEWLKAVALNNDPELNSLLDRCYRKHIFGIFTVLVRHDSRACPDLP